MIKTSNIVTFVLDDPAKGFTNLYPLHKGDSDFSVTETWQFPAWLDHYSIKYNTKPLTEATAGDWYPIGINFWDHDHDYLGSLNPRVIDLLSSKQLSLLFYYRESDDPVRIRNHINHMCSQYHIDPEMILLISGSTAADAVDGCMWFWHFDVSYFMQTQRSPVIDINHGPRSRKITCLNRFKKNWREYFVYNLCRHAVLGENYISYGNYISAGHDDSILWHPGNLGLGYESQQRVGERCDLQVPDNQWLSELPLQADQLTLNQHNDHSLIINEHFQDSYWNIVMETVLGKDDGTGPIFLTEKTLKPIRNGQAFVILGCPGSLQLLQDRGYQTFGTIIDESYDQVDDLRERWYMVYQLAKYLTKLDHGRLSSMQNQCLPIIQHNQQHFFRSRKQQLENIIDQLCN